jgi:hypothetical protein
MIPVLFDLVILDEVASLPSRDNFILGMHIMGLPDELLKEILLYLQLFNPTGGLSNESIKNLKAVAEVSKPFNTLAQPLIWESIVLSFNNAAASKLNILLTSTVIDSILAAFTKEPVKILTLFNKISTLYIDLGFQDNTLSEAWYDANAANVDDYLTSCSAIVPAAEKFSILDLTLSSFNLPPGQKKSGLQKKIITLLNNTNVGGRPLKEFNLTLKMVSDEDMKSEAAMLLPFATSLQVIGMPLAVLLPYLSNTNLTKLTSLELVHIPNQLPDPAEDVKTFWTVISKSAPNISTLFITEIPVPSVVNVVVDFSKIVNFGIVRTFPSADEFSKTALTIFQSMPNLEDLTVVTPPGNVLPALQYAPANVVCVKLKTAKFVGLTPVALCSNLFVNCLKLTELSVEQVDILDDFPPCGNVQILSLKECRFGGWNGLSHSVAVQKLRLDFGTACRLKFKMLRDLKVNCVTLQVIEISPSAEGYGLGFFSYLFNDADVAGIVKQGTTSSDKSFYIFMASLK